MLGGSFLFSSFQNNRFKKTFIAYIRTTPQIQLELQKTDQVRRLTQMCNRGRELSHPEVDCCLYLMGKIQVGC